MDNGRSSTVAERLKIALEMRAMKAVDLSEKTGISKPSISCYLSGKYEPSPVALYKMGKALNVSDMWLYGFDAPMQRSMEQLNNDIIGDLVTLAAKRKYNRIKEVRQSVGITEEKLASEIGIDLETLSKFESWEEEPTTKQYIKISEVTGKSITYIMGYSIKDETEDTRRIIDSIFTDLSSYEDDNKEPEWESISAETLYKEQMEFLQGKLLKSFSLLNDEGKIEAVKRVDELSLIEKYRLK